MLKVAVFGIGRGGEAVAQYLSTELGTVEIIEVIDWSSSKNVYRDPKVMRQIACHFISPYIGKVDLVVLADYALSLVTNSLKKQWPEQKIISMEVDFRHAPKSCQNANVVTLIANGILFQSKLGREICRQLSSTKVILPDCSGWEGLIDSGDMSKDILEIELSKTFILASSRNPISRHQKKFLDENLSLRSEVIKFLLRTTPVARPSLALAGVGETGMRTEDSSSSCNVSLSGFTPRSRRRLPSPQVVYLLGTHFWNVEDDLQEIFGYGTLVVDFRRKLLHDVCLALRLRGLDGRLGE